VHEKSAARLLLILPAKYNTSDGAALSKDGKPVDMDVVVEGFIVANGVTWKEDTLFVSETILARTPKTKEGEKNLLLRAVSMPLL
jgi:hypothetical protein